MEAAGAPNLLRSEAELVLEESRRQKAERTKNIGSPIELPGKALAIEIRGNVAWIAENTGVVRKLDLESGKTLQLFRGHSAPVTSLAFFDSVQGSGDSGILVTGSWDKTIKLWNVETKRLISSTPAHSDFVKTLFVIPSLNLLISGGSDKIVRFWDLSTYGNGQPLCCTGSISAHTRPVGCMSAHALSASSAVLYTADTMGIIKVWELTREEGHPPRWRSIMQKELTHHRTRINEILYDSGQLWTASTDETVHVQYEGVATSKPDSKPIPPITHPAAVKAILPLPLTPLAEPYLLTGAGDIIRVYDISTPEEPELLREVDGHWHDVTALRLWTRTTAVEGTKGQVQVEPWVVSTSLDGTIRKWRLVDLLSSAAPTVAVAKPPPREPTPPISNTFKMSEEEERELAELMDSD